VAIRIGELLVQDGVLTPEQVDKALTAQKIYGGRLGTNLIEQGFVTEHQVAAALSRQLDIPIVDADRLATIRPEALHAIPRDVVERFRVLPFDLSGDGKHVSLASAEPANLDKLDQLQFVLGQVVKLHLCPELVLASALERHFGMPREKRFISIAPTGAAVRAQVPVPQRGSSATTGRLRRDEGADVLARIIDAPTKQQLIATVLETLGAFARQRVFFAARAGAVAAWEARGLPLDVEALRLITLPVQGSPALASVLAGESARPETDSALWSRFETALFADREGGALLLPLPVGRQVWGVLLLSGLREPRLLDDHSYLTRVLERVSWRLQALELMERIAQPLPEPA
jgi:hypothetical protein